MCGLAALDASIHPLRGAPGHACVTPLSLSLDHTLPCGDALTALIVLRPVCSAPLCPPVRPCWQSGRSKALLEAIRVKTGKPSLPQSFRVAVLTAHSSAAAAAHERTAAPTNDSAASASRNARRAAVRATARAAAGPGKRGSTLKGSGQPGRRTAASGDELQCPGSGSEWEWSDGLDGFLWCAVAPCAGPQCSRPANGGPRPTTITTSWEHTVVMGREG